MKNNYKIGQTVVLDNSFTGKVINVLSFGNKDIRPPYNASGVVLLEGIKPYIGYHKIIPNEWEILYQDEIKEENVKQLN